MDTDQDGFISLAELKAGIHQLHSVHLSEEDLKEVFNAMDDVHDGLCMPRRGAGVGAPSSAVGRCLQGLPRVVGGRRSHATHASQHTRRNVPPYDAPTRATHDTPARRMLSSAGRIEVSEFVAAAVQERHMITEHQLHEAFGKMDPDHSGYLERDNLRDLLEGHLSDTKSIVSSAVSRPPCAVRSHASVTCL